MYVNVYAREIEDYCVQGKAPRLCLNSIALLHIDLLNKLNECTHHSPDGNSSLIIHQMATQTIITEKSSITLLAYIYYTTVLNS